MKWTEQIGVFVIAGVMTVFGNMLGYHCTLWDSLIGYIILMAITLLGIWVTHIMPIKLPMVFWISIVSILISAPISPLAPVITTYANKVDFLALCTTVLAYAGLSVGKDLGMFKQMSWRIVVVALAVYTGTFVFATIIAQSLLHIEGII